MNQTIEITQDTFAGASINVLAARRQAAAGVAGTACAAGPARVHTSHQKSRSMVTDCILVTGGLMFTVAAFGVSAALRTAR